MGLVSAQRGLLNFPRVCILLLIRFIDVFNTETDFKILIRAMKLFRKCDPRNCDPRKCDLRQRTFLPMSSFAKPGTWRLLICKLNLQMGRRQTRSFINNVHSGFLDI